ncbi:MAG: tRNA (adenosine(37)-N6)-threonylcarbamoyltransferase complex transferase subunit TsaD, partial [Methanothrix sp.]|nr:tRNA (adenosine(37)-N6)-threonylcarbamoyltransferase complex transferase subunit TsaD [Methanothrix sp.]
MIVFGLEGTAWNLSAALVDDRGVIYEKSATYIPAKGGIHPREAAQHHAEYMPKVVGDVLAYSCRQGLKIDAIAFSQGPGLGPCLRTVATAARSLSLHYSLPLIGVNHCVSHIEVGKWQSGATDPAVIYVSGANSQVLALRQGRYRIFGETLDISVGNAIDKFARSVGLSHPGGPKVEELARKATKYIPLPYTVKGMDLSFSGLSTAASEAAKKHDLADVCY